MAKWELPINYTKLHWTGRREVRELYIREQNNLCAYCGCDLQKKAPSNIRNKRINWKAFPPNFLKYPVHLQHNHDTGMTEGAVHNYCNAVLWQYEGR